MVYTTALARGRFDGKSLVDVKEIFIAEPWMDLSGGDASRIVFAPGRHAVHEFVASPG